MLLELVGCDFQKHEAINFSSFPQEWIALTKKNDTTLIYQPCDSQINEIVIQKAEISYGVIHKGEWMMTYVTGQDGIDYAILALTKKDRGYQLKALSSYDKEIIFNIMNLDVQKQTASWEWLDEKNQKQTLQMVTKSGAMQYPKFIEPAETCYGSN